MCGRYASSRARDDLARAFSAVRIEGSELPPAYNVAPTDDVYVVLTRSDGESATARTLRTARWGLLPPGHNATSGQRKGPPLINARMETITTTNAFRSAVRRHRCLLPADGYYEWKATPSGKQPYFQQRTDGAPIAFAGVYSWWRDDSRDADDPAAWVCSASIITRAADPDLSWLHDRMPVMLGQRHWDHWLARDVDAPDALADLSTHDSSAAVSSYPVSRAVNAVRNDGAELVRPVTDLDD